MDGREPKDVRPGLTVDIVLKQDTRMGRLTRGAVKDALTKSSYHPHGFKVGMKTDEVDRVKAFAGGREWFIRPEWGRRAVPVLL